MKAMFKRLKPEFLFVCGLVIMICFIFQGNLIFRAFQVFLFVLLSLLLGKRFKLLPNLIMLLSVTLIYLITPRGRILFSLGGWAITQGSLFLGLYRGLLLVGLIYVSRCFISPRLKLPGIIGSLLGDTFSCFELINENKNLFSLRRPFVSLDEMMIKISRQREEPAGLSGAQKEEAPGRARFGDYLVPVFLLILNGGLLAFPYLWGWFQNRPV
ncbi:MAG: hypothetical protein LBQ61_05915 [Spirochaetales bacterium]|jgi:hypothetical protein|nr:hypothetical protein [Spirochaetales bacterium]